MRGAREVGDEGLARRTAHFLPVRAKDTPGFIVNHAGRGHAPGGAGALPRRTRSTPCCASRPGFRLGPFELLDLTGL